MSGRIAVRLFAASRPSEMALPRGVGRHLATVLGIDHHGAITELVRVDPGDHVAVMAALGRLGMQGGWDRLRAGETLAGLDHVDAELLMGAGLLERAGGERYVGVESDLAPLDGVPLGHGMVAQLHRALEHVDRRAAGWEGTAPATMLTQGRSSRAAGDHIAGELLPLMAGSRAAVESGNGRFLDVGVGVAARLCQLFPGLTCVGIDVLPSVLRLASAELDGLGLADRVELREQSVTDLPDREAFDLVWLPQPFIPRPAFEVGLLRVFSALRPDRWAVVPLALTSTTNAFEEAVFTHTAHVLGGGPIGLDEAESLVAAAGFDRTQRAPWRGQMFLLARRP